MLVGVELDPIWFVSGVLINREGLDKGEVWELGFDLLGCIHCSCILEITSLLNRVMQSSTYSIPRVIQSVFGFRCTDITKV